jgi:hypothetical protein
MDLNNFNGATSQIVNFLRGDAQKKRLQNIAKDFKLEQKTIKAEFKDRSDKLYKIYSIHDSNLDDKRTQTALNMLEKSLKTLDDNLKKDSKRVDVLNDDSKINLYHEFLHQVAAFANSSAIDQDIREDFIIGVLDQVEELSKLVPLGNFTTELRNYHNAQLISMRSFNRMKAATEQSANAQAVLELKEAVEQGAFEVDIIPQLFDSKLATNLAQNITADTDFKTAEELKEDLQALNILQQIYSTSPSLNKEFSKAAINVLNKAMHYEDSELHADLLEQTNEIMGLDRQKLGIEDLMPGLNKFDDSNLQVSYEGNNITDNNVKKMNNISTLASVQIMLGLLPLSATDISSQEKFSRTDKLLSYLNFVKPENRLDSLKDIIEAANKNLIPIDLVKVNQIVKKVISTDQSKQSTNNSVNIEIDSLRKLNSAIHNLDAAFNSTQIKAALNKMNNFSAGPMFDLEEDSFNNLIKLINDRLNKFMSAEDALPGVDPALTSFKDELDEYNSIFTDISPEKITVDQRNNAIESFALGRFKQLSTALGQLNKPESVNDISLDTKQAKLKQKLAEITKYVTKNMD